MSTQDKLNNSLSVVPEFAKGEQPTSEKFSYAFRGIDKALNRLEGAFGPIRDDNNVALSRDRVLLTNAARVIGPAGRISPNVSPGEILESTVVLSTRAKAWKLPVWPFQFDGDGVFATALGVVLTGTFKDSSSNDVFPSTGQVTDPTQPLTLPGQWIYDTRTNSLFSYSELYSLGSGGYVTMTSMVGIEGCNSHPSLVAPLGFEGVGHATPNVIPPLGVLATSVVITESAAGSTGSYLVSIYPEVANYNSPNLSVQTNDWSNELSYTPSSINGFATANGLAGELGAVPIPYQTALINQHLPVQFDQTYSADELMSRYAVYLFKVSGAQSYPELNYYYNDRTSFHVSGRALATGSGYRVVVPGESLADAVDVLRWDMCHHRHQGPASILHKDIAAKGFKPADPSVFPEDGGLCRILERSIIPGNEHPQYLMRIGRSTDGTDDPEALNNVMMGPLVFGYQADGYSTATSVHIADFCGVGARRTSYGIIFGEDVDIRLNDNHLDFVNTAGGQLRAKTEHAVYDNFAQIWGGAFVVNSLVAGNDVTLHGVDVGCTSSGNAFAAPKPTIYNQVEVFGHSATAVVHQSTGNHIAIFGSGINATCTNICYGEVKNFGTSGNVRLGGQLLGDPYYGFGVENYSTRNINSVDSLADNHLAMDFDGVKYIITDRFVVDQDNKYMTAVITPDQWYLAATDHSPDTLVKAPLYLYWDWANGSSMLHATTPTGSDFIAIVHLPMDAHVTDISLGVNVGDDWSFDVYTMNGEGTGFPAAYRDAGPIAATDARTSPINFDVSASSVGVAGARYPDYAGTCRSLILRIINAGDAVNGMTAAISTIKYKQMRI